ncbi:MAG: hypothetical protein ACRCX4_13895 [Bacteroidales bacterium]
MNNRSYEKEEGVPKRSHPLLFCLSCMGIEGIAYKYRKLDNYSLISATYYYV